MKVYLDFSDWWVGLYRGPNHYYVCVVPCVVIRWPRHRVRGWFARLVSDQPLRDKHPL